MSDHKQIIHIRIRDLRREKALTQEELAEALGLSRQSINAMEAGRCLPSLPVAVQIASFFSVPLTAVFEAPELSVLEHQNSTLEDPSMSQLIPWLPLREMRQALDGLMEESTPSHQNSHTNVPAVNISQTAREITVEWVLPGYHKEQLSIEVGENFLTIAGEAMEEFNSQEFFHREFALRSFARTISLPSPVYVDQADAEMKQGILTISLKKVVEEKPRTAKLTIKSID